MRYFAIVCLCVLLSIPSLGAAQTVNRAFNGTCASQTAGLSVSIDFTPTGGDFNAGTGTATAVFTVENTTILYPFQTSPIGNPVLTRVFFNVPANATVSLTEARVLSGASVRSLGVTIKGETIPPGCDVLGADEVHTLWYDAQKKNAIEAGQFGTFNAFVGTFDENSIDGGLVTPSAIVGCVKQGEVFSDLAVAGTVAFTIALTGLDLTLTSAQDFVSLCSTAGGSKTSAAFAGKYQGVGVSGGQSCRIGDGGTCTPVPVHNTTWGAIKAIYAE